MFQKILIIRFSSIGDLILTTPVIRCVKKQLQPEIHLLCKTRFKEVLEHNPYITKIWTIDKSVKELHHILRMEQFDLILDLQYNLRSLHLCMLLGRPSIRFHKLNFKKWLYSRFKIKLLPRKHLVDRYFEAIGRLGINNDGQGLDYHFGNNKPSSELNFSLPTQFVVGILGASYYTKQIPVEKWIEIINAMDTTFVLLGGNDVIETGSLLQNKFSGKVISLAGKTKLEESAAIIRDSKMILSPDTGMMHIAAALRKHMHVFWGNTIPEFGMYPYYGLDKPTAISHEVEGLSCRPCSKLGYPQCPLGHFNCMHTHVINKKILE